MIEENGFVPFVASELPPGPWLVFAPHGDDETFGMGGSILRAKAAGISVHLIVMTDGALGGERDDLVAIRQAEVESAASFLGIRSLESWGLPDRGLQATDQVIAKTQRSIEALSPSSVFFPGAFEPHPDHRMTARIVWSALRGLRNINAAAAITAYSYEIGVQSPINILLDITDVMSAKKHAIDLYNSQNSENDYPDLVIALNRARTFSLPKHMNYAEGLFKFSESAFNGPLKSEIDLYYEQYWQ